MIFVLQQYILIIIFHSYTLKIVQTKDVLMCFQFAGFNLVFLNSTFIKLFLLSVPFKPLFLCFQGESKGNIWKNWVKALCYISMISKTDLDDAVVKDHWRKERFALLHGEERQWKLFISIEKKSTSKIVRIIDWYSEVLFNLKYIFPLLKI